MKTIKLNKYPIILPKKQNHIITPDDEFALHGIFVVCGKRGSGKSVAVSSKLRHLKSSGFADRIFLISPTAVSNTGNWKGLIDEEDIYSDMDNSSIDEIKSKIEDESQDWEKYINATKLYKKLQRFLKSKKSLELIDQDFLDECYDLEILNPETYEIHEPKSKYGHRPVMHLILDDCQSSKLFVSSTTNKFLNLCIRHRHIGSMKSLGQSLGVSIWVLIQNYSAMSGLPKAIRGNCTQLVLFKIQDDTTIEKIMKECGGECDKETFLNVYKFATKEPHDFLVVDFNAKKNSCMYRRNWDEFIILD